MTAEQRLRAIAELTTAAEKQQREKLREYRGLRAMVHRLGTYDELHVAEAGLASATERLEDLRDQLEEATAEWQAEYIRAEGLPAPQIEALA